MTLLHPPPDRLQDDDALIRYEDDTHGWALQQVELLRSSRLDAIDVVNIMDEVADVAGREYDKLESALARVFQHLSKWDHQPERRSRSWVLSIEDHRERTAKLLRKHLGLKGDLGEIMAGASASGRYAALRETGLPKAALPEANPYGWDDVMTCDISWPET